MVDLFKPDSLHARDNNGRICIKPFLKWASKPWLNYADKVKVTVSSWDTLELHVRSIYQSQSIFIKLWHSYLKSLKLAYLASVRDWMDAQADLGNK